MKTTNGTAFRHGVALLALCGVGSLAACDEAGSPLLEPSADRPAILDSRDTGEAYEGSGVFILPPIDQSSFTRTAPFDNTLDPRVEICQLDVQSPQTADEVEAAECLVENGEVVLAAWFETDAAHDATTFISVTPEPGEPAVADSLYQVNWKTVTSQANQAFRAFIQLPDVDFSGGTATVSYRNVASFDVALYDNASTQLDSDRIYGFNAGKNAPIKFMIEEGSACDGLDCFVYAVDCTEAVYRTEHAGVALQANTFQDCDETSATDEELTLYLYQERLSPADWPACFPQGLFDGVGHGPCYVWTLYQEKDGVGIAASFEQFEEQLKYPATVQFCNDPVTADGFDPDLAGLYRYSAYRPAGSQLVELPAADEAFEGQICPYDGDSTPVKETAFLRLIQPMLHLFGIDPDPLYADDLNTRSGTTEFFSNFFPATPFDLAYTSTDITAVLVSGSADISFRLTSPHTIALQGAARGIAGQWLEYTVDEGAALSPAPGTTTQACDTPGTQCLQVRTSEDDTSTLTTDEAGFAPVTLTMGSAAESVTVTAAAVADPADVVATFTIDVILLEVAFLEPVDTGDFSGNPDERFLPTLKLCDIADPQCATPLDIISTSDIKLVEEKTGRKFYQTSWKAANAGDFIGRTLRAHVFTEGADVGQSVRITITSGGKTEQTGEDDYSAGEKASIAFKFTITPVL